MQIAVIGLGSMGKRRIRLLKQYSKENQIIGIDNNTNRMKEVKDQYSIITYANLEECLAENNINVAFVATAPLLHSSIIKECLENDINVFTEINLVKDGYDDNVKVAEEKDLVLFLSSTFLYRKEIQYIKKEVCKNRKNINYIYHTGQYLPDWHPWEGYKDFFVGDKRTNACREIFAIELPWIIDTFGEIVEYQVLKGKMSTLDIDYPDNYMITFVHENGIKGSFILDIVSRKASRNLEVIGEDISLSWNGTPEGLCRYSIEEKKDKKIELYSEVYKLKDYSTTIIENAYMSEIKSFFDVLSKKEKPIYTFEEDKKILTLIDKIEGK